ncbi:VOC family protein (plasmid) [Roseomonas sp. CCTCC AB2023176]|uniref:VOC family protein n=1 Tax=Roseomonas sp. CCTCC AB2023176 TaxID=3342640 RepID=UPI0035E0DF71
MDRRHLLSAAAFAAIALPAASEAAPAATAGMRFDHVSLNVRDFEAALAWYGAKLGFRTEVAWRVAALNGKRLAYLRLNDTMLELVEADAGGIGLPEAMTFPEHFGRTGYGHLCFRVDDVEAVLAGLAAEGVPTFVRAETYDLDGTPFRRRVGFVKDMEGNVLEFGEPLQRVG